MSKVSIIMAAYNADAFIDQAIKSVQKQTHKDWELLIVDDNSSDNTLGLARTYSRRDSRIRVITSFTNGGPAAARNIGLKAATGKWITVLDADDKYVKNRLEVLLAHAENNGLDIVADNQHYFDAGADRFTARGFHIKNDAVPLTAEMFVRNDFPQRKFPFGLLKPFLRTAFVRAHEARYPEQLRFGEDFSFLYSLLLRTDKAALVKDPLYIYTLPVGARSRKPSERSRTDRTEGWIAYQKMCASYRREALRLRPLDDSLIQALDTREKHVSTLMGWNAARDPSRKYAAVRRWLVGLNPKYMLFVMTKLRDAATKKHPIWVPQQSQKTNVSCLPATVVEKPRNALQPAMHIALPVPQPKPAYALHRAGGHDPRAWKKHGDLSIPVPTP